MEKRACAHITQRSEPCANDGSESVGLFGLGDGWSALQIPRLDTEDARAGLDEGQGCSLEIRLRVGFADCSPRLWGFGAWQPSFWGSGPLEPLDSPGVMRLLCESRQPRIR